jgi:hypothetical protein
MPAGKGKKMLRCSIGEALHERLIREAQGQTVDLGAVIEGHLQRSYEGERTAERTLMLRLQGLSQGQERILNVLTLIVEHLEGRTVPQEAPEEPALPVASYEAMYGPEPQGATPPHVEDPHGTHDSPKTWFPWRS